MHINVKSLMFNLSSMSRSNGLQVEGLWCPCHHYGGYHVLFLSALQGKLHDLILSVSSLIYLF